MTWSARRRLGARGHTTSAAATVALLAAACNGQSPQSEAQAAPLPAGPAVVDVAMSEYRYDYNSAVPAGRVVFRFHNAGNVDHDVDLLPLGDDVPPIEVQVRGSVRRPVAPFAQLPARRPGGTGTFAVDLKPGQRYALICSLATDGKSHAVEGMTSEFRAGRHEPRRTTP